MLLFISLSEPFFSCNIDVLCDIKKLRLYMCVCASEWKPPLGVGVWDGMEFTTNVHICVLHSGIHYKMHTHIKFNTFQKVMFHNVFSCFSILSCNL